ncbi:MAG: DNA repair protein RecO [Lachnospiraceae bacterium]|nr:DNA repair protein RecO [Lachnospiraceae bacterium]
MQNGIEVNGIILSVMPAGEADRRLLLLTKELGKVSCFARGARRPTSSLCGSTRPFAFGLFTLNQGRSAYSLSKAEIRTYFEDLPLDVEKSACASAFCELAAYFTRENADESGILALLYYALRALSAGKMHKRLIQAAFECRMLAESGLLPAFSLCARCKKTLTEGVFSTALMQPLCRDCAGSDLRYPLSKSTVYALEFIRNTAPGKLFSFELAPSVRAELLAVTELLLKSAVDRELPARDMLSVLLSDSGA